MGPAGSFYPRLSPMPRLTSKMLARLARFAGRLRTAARDSRGITVVEVSIAGALLSLAMIAFLASLDSTTQASSFAQARARALDDLRTAAASFSREARQASDEPTSVTTTEVRFRTYLNGATSSTPVAWKLAIPTAGSAADLQRSVDDGLSFTPRGLPPLLLAATESHFSYDPDTKLLKMVLVTRPSARISPVRLETEVNLRNAL